jgi:4-hydroxybenzoate polyprenyltransferase
MSRPEGDAIDNAPRLLTSEGRHTSGAVADGLVPRYSRLVALPHTIFSLPFALGATALAWRHTTLPFSLGRLLWIVVAVAGARTFAMAVNRLADRRLDALNPRTQNRELPRGAVSVAGATALACLGATLFLVAALSLGPWPLRLAPLALAILAGYSFAKRFTWATHVWLGIALGGAPAGAWIAVTGDFGRAPLVLALAVAAWVAGFDIIYSCQDAAFDRGQGLGSAPARFGLERALWLSRLLHVAAVAGLVAFGWLLHLGIIYAVGVVAIAVTLAYEQRLVSPNDLSRVNKAFFDLNGWVSLLFGACTIVEALR